MASSNASASLIAGTSIQAETAVPQAQQFTQAFFQSYPVQNASSIETQHNDYTSLSFPSDTARYYMTLDVSTYSRPSTFSVKVNPSGRITLPLPLQMIDNHAISYEQKELGTQVGTGYNTVAGSQMGGAFNNLKDTLAVFGRAGLDLAEKFVPLQDAITAAGYAPNQFLTVLLKGPQYKKHSFTWKLSPRNEGETEVLRRIIANLNEWSSPSLDAGGLYFGWPKVFSLSFVPNGKMLYRFLPCVIENITVNYTSSSMPAFYRGTGGPDTIEMNISFLELEFWLSGQSMFQV